ncbi:hypothetical protein [Aquabacterium sp.]|uniref:hypothetical protein n=1 Tax=Aquabacterium sp. TaxID=1872578 RepID=UPI002BDA59E8|nr:hypothetical protein [Aquabacterium sp.]HSW04420.1 hypothetical protein [Aquabacterium sp.]
MFKQTALILATAIAASGALAQQLQLNSPASPELAGIEATGGKLAPGAASHLTRIGETGPRFNNDMTTADGGVKAQRRSRTEYANVMGMSLTAWLVSRPQ